MPTNHGLRLNNQYIHKRARAYFVDRREEHPIPSRQPWPANNLPLQCRGLMTKRCDISFSRRAMHEPPKNAPNDGSENAKHDEAIVTGSPNWSSPDQRIEFVVGTIWDNVGLGDRINLR